MDYKMLIIPVDSCSSKTKEHFKGISVSTWPRCAVVAIMVFMLLFISSCYHSILYGYIMPTWAPYGIVLTSVMLSMRWRLSMSESKAKLIRQFTIFGISVFQRTFKLTGPIQRFHLVPTRLAKNQFYFVFSNQTENVSLHYCTLPSKRKALISYQISSMFNLKMPED